MKKIFSTILITIISFCITYAQTSTKEFHSCGEKNYVVVNLPNTDNENQEIITKICFDKLRNLVIKQDKVEKEYYFNMILDKNSTLNLRNYLIQVKEKFTEWNKIAQKNNIVSFDKIFPFDSPVFTEAYLEWSRNNRNYYGFSKIDPITMHFNIDASGKSCIYANGECRDEERKKMTKWTLTLSDINELQELIDGLSIPEIQKVNNLFK